MNSLKRAMYRLGVVVLNVGALSLCLVSVASAAPAVDGIPQGHSRARAAATTGSGLFIVTFKTSQGQIRVFLPAEMQPGDAIVSTTVIEPRGRRETDKDANRSQLAAYTLSLAGQVQPVLEPVQHWSLPADIKPDAATLALMDASHQEAAA